MKLTPVGIDIAKAVAVPFGLLRPVLVPEPVQLYASPAKLAMCKRPVGSRGVRRNDGCGGSKSFRPGCADGYVESVPGLL